MEMTENTTKTKCQTCNGRGRITKCRPHGYEDVPCPDCWQPRQQPETPTRDREGVEL